MNQKYKIVEFFTSINGEGRRVGEIVLFIRFKGCNLNCSYCDTTWANEESAHSNEFTADEIIDLISEKGISNVTLTGGEPLIQPNILELMDNIISRTDVNVEVETNGSVDMSIFKKNLNDRVSFTMDYKLPTSGMESSMFLNNLRLVELSDSVKFVTGSMGDMERAKEVIDEYGLDLKTNVFFSPVFGQIEPRDMVDFMLSNKMNGVKLQLQLHKFIWDPNQRGV